MTKVVKTFNTIGKNHIFLHTLQQTQMWSSSGMSGWVTESPMGRWLRLAQPYRQECMDTPYLVMQ